jgi:hypothetical protein
MNPRGKRKVKRHGLIIIQVKKVIVEGHDLQLIANQHVQLRQTCETRLWP